MFPSSSTLLLQLWKVLTAPVIISSKKHKHALIKWTRDQCYENACNIRMTPAGRGFDSNTSRQQLSSITEPWLTWTGGQQPGKFNQNSSMCVNINQVMSYALFNFDMNPTMRLCFPPLFHTRQYDKIIVTNIFAEQITRVNTLSHSLCLWYSEITALKLRRICVWNLPLRPG